MRTATITVQLDTSDAPLTEEQARDALGSIVDMLADETYVSAAHLNALPEPVAQVSPCYCDSAYHPAGHVLY